MAVTHSNRNGTSLAVAATTGVVAFLLTVVVGVEAVPTLCYHINTNTHPAFRIRARQQQQQHDPLQRVSRTYSPLQLQLPPHPFEPKGRLSSSARFSSKDDNGDDAANDGDDDEWFPHDPAWTTPQLLEGIWSQIAQAQDLVHGVSIV